MKSRLFTDWIVQGAIAHSLTADTHRHRAYLLPLLAGRVTKGSNAEAASSSYHYTSPRESAHEDPRFLKGMY